MSNIKYIAYVDVTTGVIDSVDFCAGGYWPDEGIIEGSDPPKQRFWLDRENWADKGAGEIFEEWFRKDNAWHRRGPKPSINHDWNVGLEEWEVNLNKFWAQIRELRTNKLLQSDWTQLGDTLSEEKRLQWRTYRQQLRDIPSTYPDARDIDDITWPTPPS